MIRNAIGLVPALMLALGAQAQAQTRLPWPDAAPTPPAVAASPEFERNVMPPMMLSVPGMDRLKIWREIDYAGSPDRFVRMDVYAPRKPGRMPRPVVLFIHGGVPTVGQAKDWGLYQSWGRLAAASGMIGATFTHRLNYPKTQVTEGAADLAAAIRHVRDNAQRYGADPNRICLVAFSAGGPTLSPYMAGAPDYVRCLVSIYTFLDIRQTKEHRESESPETLERYSPIARLRDQGPKTPLMVVRAGRDAIPTLLDSADRFIAEAIATDYPLTLVNVPEAPHGFDNKEPTPRRIEALRAVQQFLIHHLQPPR